VPGEAALLGTYHLVPAGETTWHGYASFLIQAARERGLPIQVAADAIAPVPASTFPAPARRPLNSRLDKQLIEQRFGLQLPDWRVHVRRFVEEIAG
jgi:dTDP-4-dehydrorhamnose reductase